MTYADVWERSGGVATKLLKAGLRPGDLVMLTFPPGLDFVPALVACLRTGVAAVSTYPPDLRRPKTELPKFAAFVRDSGARVGITSPAFFAATVALRAAGYSSPHGVDEWVRATSNHRVAGERLAWDVSPAPDDLAFLQYTSGSTGEPKGCMITHRVLRHGIAAVSGWLPTWLPNGRDLASAVPRL